MKLFLSIGISCALLSGCAHEDKPASSPSSSYTYPSYSPEAPVPLPPSYQEPSSILAHYPAEVPCGQELVVKVGKLNVDIPDGKFDIMGSKGDVKKYHVVLEGVEFTNRHYCSK